MLENVDQILSAVGSTLFENSLELRIDGWTGSKWFQGDLNQTLEHPILTGERTLTLDLDDGQVLSQRHPNDHLGYICQSDGKKSACQINHDFDANNITELTENLSTMAGPVGLLVTTRQIQGVSSIVIFPVFL